MASNEQKRVFAERLAQFDQDYQDQWYLLENRLIASTCSSQEQFLVPLPVKDIHLSKILARGEFFMYPPRQLLPGEASGCHANVARLLLAGTIATVYTGYALNEDGLWRQHSWSYHGDEIVETTVDRLAYYGYALTFMESLCFVLGNVAQEEIEEALIAAKKEEN